MAADNPSKIAKGGMHKSHAGTSFASPIVAGIAALYFQHCPEATYADVKTALINAAKLDGFTGSSVSTQWGNGKADAYQTLLSTLFTPQLTPSSDLSLCEGDSLSLRTTKSFDTYQWSNGDTTAIIDVSASGNYSVKVTDQQGCPATSEAVRLTVHPLPPRPSISFSGFTFSTGAAYSYQWYREGNAVSGANDSIFVTDVEGAYFVEATDENGCSSFSDTLEITIDTAIVSRPLKLYPNPSPSGIYTLEIRDEFLDSRVEVLLYDKLGRQVYRQPLDLDATRKTELDLSFHAAGPYILRVKGKHKSIYEKLVRK